VLRDDVEKVICMSCPKDEDGKELDPLASDPRWCSLEFVPTQPSVGKPVWPTDITSTVRRWTCNWRQRRYPPSSVHPLSKPGRRWTCRRHKRQSTRQHLSAESVVRGPTKSCSRYSIGLYRSLLQYRAEVLRYTILILTCSSVKKYGIL
jgi:hypothetical protein